MKSEFEKRLEEMEKIANGATPGPWRSDYCGDVWTESLDVPKVDEGGMAVFRTIGTTPRGPDNGDGAFIAAANPATVLGLIRTYQTLYQHHHKIAGWFEKSEPGDCFQKCGVHSRAALREAEEAVEG